MARARPAAAAAVDSAPASRSRMASACGSAPCSSRRRSRARASSAATTMRRWDSRTSAAATVSSARRRRCSSWRAIAVVTAARRPGSASAPAPCSSTAIASPPVPRTAVLSRPARGLGADARRQHAHAGIDEGEAERLVEVPFAGEVEDLVGRAHLDRQRGEHRGEADREVLAPSSTRLPVSATWPSSATAAGPASAAARQTAGRTRHPIGARRMAATAPRGPEWPAQTTRRRCGRPQG